MGTSVRPGLERLGSEARHFRDGAQGGFLAQLRPQFAQRAAALSFATATAGLVLNAPRALSALLLLFDERQGFHAGLVALLRCRRKPRRRAAAAVARSRDRCSRRAASSGAWCVELRGVLAT